MSANVHHLAGVRECAPIRAPGPRSVLARLRARLRRAALRQRSIAELERLDDRQLADIGVRRRDIAAVVERALEQRAGSDD